MAAQARTSIGSYHGLIKRYKNCGLNLFFYCLVVSRAFACEEKMWWWLDLAREKMWWWIASFGKSYNGDVLQYAKQFFFSGFCK
jgi:hypothetical protein